MTGLLLVCHGEIGAALLAQARLILDDPLKGIETLQVSSRDELAVRQLTTALDQADQGEGVLVMTDLPGATPCNLALQFAETHPCKVISGLNLPMLLRAWNYRQQPLRELASLALEGGRKAMVELS